MRRRITTSAIWKNVGWRAATSRSRQHGRKFLGLYSQADIERSELRVHRAYFIKTHLVDEPLEDQRLFREEVHSPLPIVKANRSRDDLLDLASISAAHQAVFMHLALALFNGQHVPVLSLAAQAIHGIKTGILCIRNGGGE